MDLAAELVKGAIQESILDCEESALIEAIEDIDSPHRQGCARALIEDLISLPL
jgi:hypothetical protein